MKWIVILSLTLISGLIQAEVRFSQLDGPNCINNALFEMKLTPTLRYSSQSELDVFLKSKFCQYIEGFTHQGRKSIGLIYSESPYANPKIISHAFIRLDENWAYEKKGYDQRQPYHEVSLDQILQDYDVIDPKKSVKYLNCLTLDEMMQRLSLSPEIKSRFNEIESIDRRLGEIVAHYPKKNDNLYHFQREIQTFLAKDFKAQSEDDLFIIKLMAARITSISHQLSVLGFGTLREKSYLFEFDSEAIESLFELLAKP